MAVKEVATKQVVINAFEPQAISSDTTTTGAIIDTADYDCGLYFAMLCYAYSAGDFTLKIEHGDNSALTDAADVDSAMLVYGTLPVVDAAALSEGDVIPKEGIHSTKRYVRVSVVSDNSASGSIAVIAIANPEMCPTAQDS